MTDENKHEPTMREVASLGGQAVVRKYGRFHMMAIAHLGGLARAAAHSHEEMQAWASMGGRAKRKTPKKKTPRQVMEELLNADHQARKTERS